MTLKEFLKGQIKCNAELFLVYRKKDPDRAQNHEIVRATLCSVLDFVEEQEKNES